MDLLETSKTKILIKKRRIDNVEARIADAGYKTYKPGETIDAEYTVVRAITGGMGMVYFCRTLGTYGPVAIKTILPEYVPSREARQLFYHEAEAWIRLGTHDNLVRALYVGEFNECLAIYLELVIGDPKYGNDLSGYLGRYSFRPEEILLLASRFCEGMIYADQRFQEMGKCFVHRDIKPSNILVTNQLTPKITDLGLVQIGKEEKKGSVGTPGYIAPEVFSGSAPNPHSDIYSFGCVLYEMFCGGKTPYTLGTAEMKAYPPQRWGLLLQQKHATQQPLDPDAFLPVGKVRSDLRELLYQCLKKDPADRFPNFVALKEALDQLYLKLTLTNAPEHHESEHAYDSDNLHQLLHELDNKAQSLFRLGHHEEALQCWDQALERSPNEPRFLRGKGDALAALSRYEEALACYDESLKIMPADIEQWMDKGVILTKLNRLTLAVECFDKALSVKVQPNTIWGNKGHPVIIHPATTHTQVEDFKRWYETEMKMAGPLLSATYFNKGIALELQGNLDNALRCFEQAIGKNPHSADSWQRKGRLLARLGRLEEADRCIEQSISIIPEEWQHQLGFSACGDDRVISDIVRILPKECEHGRVGYLLFKGVELLQQGNPVEALTYIDEYLAFENRNTLALYYKAIAYGKVGKHDDAIRCLDTCLLDWPDWATVWATRGNILAKQGDTSKLDEAINSFDRALGIDDRHPEIHTHKAALLYSLGKKKEAVQCLQDASRVAGRWIEEGVELDIEEKHEEAIDALNKALAFAKGIGSDSGYAAALGCKGSALLGLKRYDEALELFDKSLETDSDNAGFWFNRGLALHCLHRYKEALESYDIAIGCKPNFGEAYQNKAATLHEIGKAKEAAKCLKKARRLGFSQRRSRFRQ